MKRLAILALAVMLLASCGQQADVVATVGKFKITKDELRKELKKRFPQQKNTNGIDQERKQDVLDKLVTKYLKINEAYALGLENDPQLVSQLENRERNLLGNKYYERVIVDKLISSKEIEDYQSKQGVEIKATHILIGYKKANRSVERTKEEAMKLANEIAQKARNGEDFSELAVKYSDEPGAKKSKGDLGYFTWGRMVQQFQEAAWNMKVGEISDPVETQFGIHVIRLDDRREVEGYQPKDDPESLLQVKRVLFKAHADTGRKMWQTHFKNLKESKNYTLDTDAINKMATAIEEKINRKELKPEDFSDKEKATVLLKWDGGQISVGDLITKFEARLAQAFGGFTKADVLKREVENDAMMKLVTDDAKSMGLDEEPDVKSVLEKFKNDRMAYIVERQQVMDKIVVDKDAVHKFYDENPDQFKKAPEIEIWEVFVKDENLAKTVARKARNGAKFSGLARKYSEDAYYKKKGGYLGFRTNKARGSVSRAAFEAGSGKIIGPIKYRNGWAVAKTGELHGERVKSFQEAKPQAESRLRNQLITERRSAWEKELKEKYDVSVKSDALTDI